MSSTRANNELSPGAGTSSCRSAGMWRNHAGMLLSIMLLVPLGAHGVSPDREYVDKLAQQLAAKLPGVTAESLTLSVTPNCKADSVQLHAIHNNVFGTPTLTLRCGDSQSLPFTASVNTRLSQAHSTPGNSKPARPLAVRSGSKVRLEIVTEAVVIFTTATVLGQGSIGDIVAVRAARTNRIVRARIVDRATVRAIGDSQ